LSARSWSSTCEEWDDDSGTGWSDEKLEQPLRDDASTKEAWALIKRFTKLVRESGSEDEWIAARTIADRLDEFGVEYRLHEPELFLRSQSARALL
jgi:hypothetical protein